MRIVQLSDIHLSIRNLDELKNYYLDALIIDLKSFHDQLPIDVIILTGDLVDKGGDSLENGYGTFQLEFINPILKALNLSQNQILFIPGNHDVNRELVEVENEFYLSGNLNTESANSLLLEMSSKFDKKNKRIEKFKNFEKEFQKDNKKYFYSNNESLAVYSDGYGTVGFALINDSWRCSPTLKQEGHFIGRNQLFNALKYFDKENTGINIAVFHHPLNAFNTKERDEIENILKSRDFDFAIFGHSHEHKFEHLVSSHGGYVSINGRTAFNDVDDKSTKYQSGYNILDINIEELKYKLHARKFIKNNGFRFDKDVDSLRNGEHNDNIVKNNTYVKLNIDSNNKDQSLPNGYSADVGRIVNLLIGKSIYPDPFVFVRELIQNSVDACTRAKDLQTYSTPCIQVNINTNSNYFEVRDEGDGMSKKTLKDHFSIIGKSISQEFNDSNGKFNLISQFGIGFISTFIVAGKVYISTKNVDDELVNFEILDVFKGFNYQLSDNYPQIDKDHSGTIIRVYLKNEYTAQNLYGIARNYCRHIDHIKFTVNDVVQTFTESWNIENGAHLMEISNMKFSAKLTISQHPRPLTASNSGFLISHNPSPILPYRFPYIIGGEINFAPKAIDFDVSRSNILETEKSIYIRKEISASLRYLFRLSLESSNAGLVSVVVTYLQYYLCNFDTNHPRMMESYSNFYSKTELIELCANNCVFQYENGSQKLNQIFNSLRAKGINSVFTLSKSMFSDYEDVVIKYLGDKGNFILDVKNINIQFRDGQQTVSLATFMSIMAVHFGFSIVDVVNVSDELIKDMKMGKSEIPTQINKQIDIIQVEKNIKIDIGKFNKGSKPSVQYHNQYYLNFEHPAFQKLIENVATISDDIIKIYLSGLLGIEF